MWQDGERLPTKPTQPSPYPKIIVPAVVRRFSPLPVSDDGLPLAQGAPTRQLVQTDPGHPGTALSSAGGNAIKRITADVRACRRFSLPGLVRRPAFTLLVYAISNEKRILPSLRRRATSACGLAGIKGLLDNAARHFRE
jgi:hypothetical protein